MTVDWLGTPAISDVPDDSRTIAVARAVFELTQRFNEFSSPADVFAAFADSLATLLTFDRMAIVLSRDNGRETSHHFNRGDDLEFSAGALTEMAKIERLSVLREPLLYAIEEQPRFAGDADRFRQGYRQGAIAPLVIDREGVGLFTMMSKDAMRWGDSELWILTSLASALGIILAASNLRREAETRRQEAEFIAEMGLAIASAREVDALVSRAVEQISTAFDAPVAAYLLEHDQVRVAAVSAPAIYNIRHVRMFTSSVIEFLDNPVSIALIRDPAAETLVTRLDAEDGDGINQILAEELRVRRVLSILTVPISAGNRTIGVLAVTHIADKGETAVIGRDRQPCVVKRLAQYLATAIDNARHYEDLTRSLNESEVLRRIMSDTAQRQDSVEGLDVVVRAAQLLYAADYVAIARIDGDTIRWLIRVGSRVAESSDTDPPVTRATDKLLAVVERLIPVLVRDFPNDPRVDPDEYPLHVDEGLRSSLTAPFSIEGDVIGLLIVGFRNLHRFDAADIRFARSLASGVAASLMRDRDA
jgi:GAF domain-containing protein